VSEAEAIAKEEEVEEGEESDERPGIDEEERAEFDFDGLAEDIENETAPDTDGEPDEGEPDQESAPSTDDEAGGAPDLPKGPEHSIGDQYVGVLALVSAAIVEEFGDEDSEDPKVVREKVEGIATQEPFDLASNVDLLLAQSGVGSDLPPGKALVLGTIIVVALVVLPETDLFSQALGRIQEEVDL